MNETNLVYSFGKVLFQAKISLFYYVNEKYIDNPSQLSSDSAHRIEGISCIDLFSFSLSHLICDSISNVVWYKSLSLFLLSFDRAFVIFHEQPKN